jgi:hypothetical protein
VIKKIAYHCACDEVHFEVLYDVTTFFDETNPIEAGYSMVINGVAYLIRTGEIMKSERR